MIEYSFIGFSSLFSSKSKEKSPFLRPPFPQSCHFGKWKLV